LRSELTRLETEAEPIPPFLKGYRNVVTYFCWDGVVVAHHPTEAGASEDTYKFLLSDLLVKQVADDYNQPLPGAGKPEELVEDYQPGEPFTSCIYPDPRQFKSPLTDGFEAIQRDKWGRLDLVNLHDAEYAWDTESEARRQAQERARHHAG
jgi:hypothetical protein